MELKLTFNKLIFSSDIKKKDDEETNLFEKDMKIVEKAIQSVCSGFFFAALNVKADWANKLGKNHYLYQKNIRETTQQ